MSDKQTAFRTTNPDAIKAWEEWVAEVEAIRVKRAALVEAVGRDIYVNRGNGFGSTRITGFARFESDKQGDLIHHDGCLIVSSYKGQHNGLIVPNIKRKSGKVFAEELRTYTTPGLDLPGMPTFHVYGSAGRMYMGGPALRLWDGTLYAFWDCDDAPVKEGWEQIPLSVYYAAMEQMEAAEHAAEMDLNEVAVSGNEENDG